MSATREGWHVSSSNETDDPSVLIRDGNRVIIASLSPWAGPGDDSLIAAAPRLLKICKRISPIIRALEMLPFHRGAEPNSLADDLFEAIKEAESHEIRKG